MEQTRRSRKKEQTHRAIMHSAKVLFEQNGINNVTIDRIAEEADVSRSTFFTHFESLDALLGEIAAEEISDILSPPEGSGKPTILHQTSHQSLPANVQGHPRNRRTPPARQPRLEAPASVFESL